MSSQFAIRLDEETKNTFARVSRFEGKSASQKMRELIDNYIRKADIKAVVDDIWERSGQKLTARGFTEQDIDRLIAETRQQS